ncbi:hypothetical protein ACV3J7_04940 [Salmonella enterica]
MINLTEQQANVLAEDLRQRIKWKEAIAPLNSLEAQDLIIYRIALEALEEALNERKAIG